MRIGRPMRRMAASALAKQRGDGEDGATLVEVALSSLLLLAFIFGVMEICLALYSYHFISEAAREGTRFAIVRGSTCTGLSGGCPASGTDIQNYVTGLGYPGIDPSKMRVNATWSQYTNGNSCPALGPCNSIGNLVTVQVTYQFPVAVPFVSLTTIPMSSTSAMVISN